MSRTLQRFLPSSLKDRWQTAGFFFAAGSVSLALVSIAAAEICLAAAILTALLRWRKAGERPRLPAALAGALLMFVLWSAAAALIGPGSLADSHMRKIILYALLLLVPALARTGKNAAWIYRAVFAVAAVSAAAGLAQFIADPQRDALHRIQGFLSIWMTFSGSLMLVLVALVAFGTTYGWTKPRWVLPLGLMLAASLFLSETRSAELGAVAGIAAILGLKRPRALVALPAIVLAAYFVSPARIQDRLKAALDMSNPDTRTRIETFGTGWRLIQAHPWLGVGTNVNTEAPKYRGSLEYPNWMYIHLHNNFLQIAAERGIPGLLFWLWFMGQLGWQALQVFRATAGRGAADAGDGARPIAFLSIAAVGGWAALVVAGMFEYNFGDSEVLILFLFMMSAPFSGEC